MRDPKGQDSSKGRSQSLTIAAIRELTKRSSYDSRASYMPPLIPQEREAEVPLSYAQERLWFLDQLGLVGSTYNSQRALRLVGNLNVQALEQSFSELVCRHESLRTHFETVAGSPIQVIGPQSPFSLDIRDLSGLSDDRKEVEWRRLCRAEARHSFRPAEGPLLRALLIRLTDHEHVLLITTHHIVADGWSWAVLNRELSELYGGYSQGQPAVLPRLAVQYADYSIWQRNWLRGEVLQRELTYWRNRLKGAPPELELPTDRPRRSVASFDGARVNFTLPASLSDGVRECARREGATLFMIVLAAYQLLLSRYCGQDDVLVGSPIAGRTHAETEGLIGFFVNTLVFRSDLSGNPPFRQLLRQVREVTLEAYEHQNLPFEKLVMELRPERNLTRQPIFQVALAVQNYPPELAQSPGLSWTRVETDHDGALFDLTLILEEGPGELEAAFVYATDLFDRATVERMAKNFTKLLEGIVEDSNCPIRLIPLLTEVERNQVLYTFNDTASDYPKDKLIHELFEEWVERAPDAVAVLWEGGTLTYAELNAKSNQLSRYLRDVGLGAGDYVPVLMARSVQMLIAQIAVLKAGAVYVPVDPDLPVTRMNFIVENCAARFILACAAAPAGLVAEAALYIDCTTVGDAIEARPIGNLSLRADKDPAAYVMYTSGSTGVPKGVVVPHHAVNRLVINNGYARIEPLDCIAHYSNPAFDSSTFEIWGALLSGARVVIVRPSDVLEGKRFSEVLDEHSVSVLYMSVGLFNQYTDVLANVFSRLRYLMVGGDSLEPGAIRYVLKNSPPMNLLNVYGPTECTTFSTTYRIANVEEGATQIPIGRPISNARIYILDDHLQVVPIGVDGEMYVGGDGVAWGYLNRQELTDERFIPDPFRNDAEARLYRTGDRARWRSDGAIEFLGRNDYQIKIRGYRIELGEIETNIADHPEIREATVLAREDVPGEKRLVAYVVPAVSRTAPTAETMQKYLRDRLPDYMVPSAFVVLECMPLNDNGKVDRKALPAPKTDAYITGDYQAPQDEVEGTIAGIWRHFLGHERIGRHDNFFQLGGHSLLALKVLFEINRILGTTLTVADAYSNPTVQELAARARGGKSREIPVILSTEAALEENIVATSGAWLSPAESILLTGCTGFVGRFLLAQLLRETNATIYCLVRPPSKLGARPRVQSILEKWNLWCDEFTSRVVEISGDLSFPRLGVDGECYKVLSERVDSIYHCATSMNHLETYEMAKPVNVDSAREVLRLAVAGKPKLVNYISTLSVFKSATGENRLINEASAIDQEQHFNSGGYAASKWVAEKMFITASQRGIPCNIFRLGLVWADSEQGRYDELQREYRILKSSLLSGKGIRHYHYEMAPVPVDYVARAVVSLSKASHAGIFHIASSQRVESVFERCNEIAGTSLQILPLYDWVCEVKRMHLAGVSLPVVPLIEYAFEMDESAFYAHQFRVRSRTTHIDCARTHAQIEECGLAVPQWTDGLLRTCVEGLIVRAEEIRSMKKVMRR